jgi:hypothetical protein
MVPTHRIGILLSNKRTVVAKGFLLVF